MRKTLGQIFLVFGCMLVAACSGSRSSSVIKECVLPQDQVGTFKGKWSITPAPVAVASSGGFTSAEVDAITASIDTWNNFYGASKGIAVMESVGSSAQSLSASTCGEPTIVSGSSFSGVVTIHKVAPWPAERSDDVIALTTTCTASVQGESIPRFTNAVIELNYENFFVSGQRQPDYQTLLTHELGHLIGLGHSCESVGSSGIPGCSDSSINPDYLAAIMFPAIAFGQDGAGEVRRDLNSNDMGRANCLY